MLSKTLPQSPAELLRWEWSDFEPLTRELNKQRLTTENIEIWLSDWSALEDAIAEKFNRLYYLNSANTADEDQTSGRWRRTHFAAWRASVGGRAWTGSSSRYLCTSAAKALADAYRRSRSLSSAFITIQSRSPRSCELSL